MDLRELARLGVEPTPSVIAPFVVSVLEREGVVSKSALTVAIEQEWARAGGKTMADKTTFFRLKKALATLFEQGIVEILTPGHYRLAGSVLGEPKVGSDDREVLRDPVSDDEARVAEPEEEEEEPIEAGRILGAGDQLVYAFSLPTYKIAAQNAGNDRWPFKIGMTTGDVAVRMAAHRTAMPEEPVVAMLIRTDNAALLEKVLQGVLTIRGHRSDLAAGSEWFITNAEEIASIYNFASGGGVPLEPSRRVLEPDVQQPSLGSGEADRPMSGTPSA